MTYLESLNGGLRNVLETVPEAVLFGEDIMDPYGGAFKVTRGLQRDFPHRVLTTPISEAGLAGLANGMALRGLRPVLEIMFGDFLGLCMDQILNHSAKFRMMYGDRVNVPLTIRTPMGGGRGYGPTHSQSIEKLFFGVPEIRIVAPSLFCQAGSLLRQAVLDDKPVLFIEHKLLYPAELLGTGFNGLHMQTSADSSGYPVVRVRNYDTGPPDVAVIAYGGMSRFIASVLSHLAEEEIKVLACLPTLIKPLPLESLVAAAGEAQRVVIVEEAAVPWGWGSEIAALLYEALLGKLRAPIRRVGALDTLIPASRPLEESVLPGAAEIEQAVFRTLQ